MNKKSYCVYGTKRKICNACNVLVRRSLSIKLKKVIKLLENKDILAYLPCTSAALNVKLEADTISGRRAQYIMTALPRCKSITGAVSKD